MKTREPAGEDERPAPERWIKTAGRFWSMALGTAIFALFIALGGRENLGRLGNLSLLPTAAALIATLCITGLIAFRWGAITNTIAGRSVTGWYGYYYYFMVGRFLGFILPKDMTDLAGRTVMLSRYHNVSVSHSATSVIFDRLGDVLAMTVLLPACLPYWFGWVSGLQGIGIMLGLASFFGLIIYIFHNRIARMIDRAFAGLTAVIRYVPGIKGKVDKLGKLPHLERGLFLTYYTTSVLKVILTAIRFALFALALEIPIPFTLLVLATPLGQLSYMFSFTPGGLGILEAGWFGILVFAGVTTEHTSAFVVGQRVLTVALITFLTVIAHIGYSFKKHQDSLPG